MIQFSDNLCMNCMGKLDGSGVCPNCRQSGIPENAPEYLPQHTVLDGQYLLGRVLRANGESAVYLALSGETGKTVEIREFFPTRLCARSGFQVNPKPGFEIQYKAFLSDFIDLHRTLSRLRDVPLLVPVLDLFEANGTVYVVSELFGGIRFGDFLNINVGELSWEQTREFLFPVLMSLQHLHENGILHRAISPDTLYVSRTGELRLLDFCLAPVRTLHSELDAELYPGYAAPEQYVPTGWQGAWTDVYAIAAVFYKTLTGTMPAAACDRADGEYLFSVSGLNESVPQEVSAILDEALAVDPNQRIQTISEFQSRLTGAQEGGSQSGDTRRVASREEVRQAEREADQQEQLERYENYIRYTKRRRKKRPHYGLLSGILATILMCSAVLYILYGMYEEKLAALSSSSSYTSVSESEYLGSTTVPPLVGMDINAATNDSTYKGKLNFSIIYEANANYAVDVIFEQSPKAGESVEVGSTINVKVSKGIQTVKMPDVVNKTQEVATEMLDLLEVDYEIIPVYEDGFEKGVVTRANYETGTELTLSRDTVYLFVNQQEYSESSSEQSSHRQGVFG